MDIEKNADEFIQSLKNRGVVVRVLKPNSCYTHDYRSNRANVVVNDNKVIRFWYG